MPCCTTAHSPFAATVPEPCNDDPDLVGALVFLSRAAGGIDGDHHAPQGRHQCLPLLFALRPRLAVRLENLFCPECADDVAAAAAFPDVFVSVPVARFKMIFLGAQLG